MPKNPPPPGSGRKRPPRDVPGARNPYIRTRKPNKPKLEPHVTTLWSYPSQHYGNREQGSRHYRGATPSWVIWEVIQRFTKKGDLVVDPFCGSGTSLDVCADTERVGRGFDIAPFRDDIVEADARELPLAPKSVDLVFMDPPYADNLKYSDAPACIGRTRADDGSYQEAMKSALHEAFRVLKRGGALAIYVQDIWHEKQQRFYPLGLMLAEIGQRQFTLVDHVCVVRNNETLSRGNYRAAAIERGFMLRGFNHLLLFKKERSGEARPDNASQTGGEKARGPANRRPGGRGNGGNSPSRRGSDAPSRPTGRPTKKGAAKGKKGGPPRGKGPKGDRTKR